MEVSIKSFEKPVPYSLKKRGMNGSTRICIAENGEYVWYEKIQADKEGAKLFYNENARYKATLRSQLAAETKIKAGHPPLWDKDKRIEASITVIFPQGQSSAYKPDLDNMLKTFLDAGTGILYKDDCQVTRISMEKIDGDDNCWTVIMSMHPES